MLEVLTGLGSQNGLGLQTAAGLASLTLLAGLGAALNETRRRGRTATRARRLADAAHEGLIVVEDGLITEANMAFCQLIGLAYDEVIGRPLSSCLADVPENEKPESGPREALLHPCDGCGAEIPVEVFERRLETGAQVFALRDLRERRQAEEKIRYLADHDGLTGLPNRAAMQERLAAAVDMAVATRTQLAVLRIDLDHFKEANDLFGHAGGDAMLMEAARRLQSISAEPGFAARLGADEFVLVQAGETDQPGAAAELASRIVEALKAPVRHGEKDLSLSASLGIAVFPEDGSSPETLFANAGMALDLAKGEARGGYRFFRRETDEAIRARRQTARELRAAIGDGDLIVHYQPLARASDGSVCGFEALVRWRHAERGMVPPMEFIPLAEETGLIGPLGDWVLRRACEDAAAWLRPLHVAVNISAVQLCRAELPQEVHEILMATELAPRRLELEITETALIEDTQRALDTLRRLKALGVGIAMDDFGTGFSSLSTLQSFPFDKLKIDKSFVDKIHRDDRGTAIVRAVLGLGRSLDIPVVAEGVETNAQLEFLRGERCEQVQGWLIGRPAPVETLGAWTSPDNAIRMAV